MRFRKLIALFLSIIMLMSFSTMFVSANTRSVSYPQSWVNVGESIQLSTSGVASATWSSSNSAIATVSSSGKVTGVSSGTAIITTACTYSNGNSEEFTTYIDVYDNRGIVNGEEYYIMNTATDKVLSLASSSTANNTGIITSARGASTTKQWKLTQQSTGKYTFVSKYNSTTKGMYANISTNDVYLYTVGSSATHFEICRINSGAYQGTYLVLYNGKYLAANSSNDVYLTTTMSINCYWSFTRVDKRQAGYYGFSYEFTKNNETHNFITFSNTTKNLFSDMFGDMGYTTHIEENKTAVYAYDKLLNYDDIFLYAGHGAPGLIAFCTTENASLGYINADLAIHINPSDTRHINSANSNALASLRFVIYLGCNTAVNFETIAGIEYNLLDSTYNKGAHLVLGATQMTYDTQSREWVEYFLEAIEDGENIGKAIYLANTNMGSPVNIPIEKADGSIGEISVDRFPVHYFGDTFQYLD